jgi:hypothetical protein
MSQVFFDESNEPFVLTLHVRASEDTLLCLVRSPTPTHEEFAVAKRTQVTLVDDLDGGVAAGSVSFALDGKSYDIDLSGRNANALRKIFTPYVEAARKMTSPKRGRARAYTHVVTDVDPAAVRAWAASNSVPVSARGRLSAAVIGMYRAAGN